MDYKRDKWMIDFALENGLTLKQLASLKMSYKQMKAMNG